MTLDALRAAEERFWAKVDRETGPVHVPELGQCWPWTAGTFRRGYGSFSFGGHRVQAPRFSLALKLGEPLTTELVACHRCDWPPCVNPEHLFPGAQSVNVRDAVAKGRHRHPVMVGADNPSAKLTVEAVVRIRAGAAAGERLSALAVAEGISRSAVHHIVSGRTWQHVPQLS